VLDDAWTSPMGFSPGVNPALNGMLDLEFAADISPGVQVGHYFQLFDWTGVQPTGSFTIVSPYEWGLSDLYTDGKVILYAVPEPASLTWLTAWFLYLMTRRRRGKSCNDQLNG